MCLPGSRLIMPIQVSRRDDTGPAVTGQPLSDAKVLSLRPRNTCPAISDSRGVGLASRVVQPWHDYSGLASDSLSFLVSFSRTAYPRCIEPGQARYHGETSRGLVTRTVTNGYCAGAIPVVGHGLCHNLADYPEVPKDFLLVGISLLF